MNPHLTFEFSEIAGAIYAVERLSESHLVKWWINHLKSSETLLSSFKKLQKQVLLRTKINKWP
ncbi:MAG: hypothetical protein B6U95_05705 [Thermofilum sp. ex4484_82]|nr:MAG: hypothetical protein B6U95_05705 [Thermofilum sp. ex4484_82]OYT37874.1 MAG: hypothetical protein B6U96_05700 [Archaeoglobales archaeon ex4484_92]